MGPENHLTGEKKREKVDRFNLPTVWLAICYLRGCVGAFEPLDVLATEILCLQGHCLWKRS